MSVYILIFASVFRLEEPHVAASAGGYAGSLRGTTAESSHVHSIVQLWPLCAEFKETRPSTCN